MREISKNENLKLPGATLCQKLDGYCAQLRKKTRLKIREDTILENFPFVLSKMQTGNLNIFSC